MLPVGFHRRTTHGNAVPWNVVIEHDPETGAYTATVAGLPDIVIDAGSEEEALSMADRIVVMNHGAIEQVGSALEIYREPASPFVADFVGKVNVLAGIAEPGAVRVGSVVLNCNGCEARAGHAVKIYLRPEDIVARPIAAGDSNVFDARIEKVEFLGSYCLVRVASDGLQQPLTVYLSLNFLSEQALERGSSLRLRVLPDRLRLFDG
jgi:iron(III) transport system ATP-binding protein